MLLTGAECSPALPAARFPEKEDQRPLQSKHEMEWLLLGIALPAGSRLALLLRDKITGMGQPCCGQDTSIRLRLHQESVAELRAPGQAPQAPRPQVASPVATVL